MENGKDQNSSISFSDSFTLRKFFAPYSRDEEDKRKFPFAKPSFCPLGQDVLQPLVGCINIAQTIFYLGEFALAIAFSPFALIALTITYCTSPTKYFRSLKSLLHQSLIQAPQHAILSVSEGAAQLVCTPLLLIKIPTHIASTFSGEYACKENLRKFGEDFTNYFTSYKSFRNIKKDMLQLCYGIKHIAQGACYLLGTVLFPLTLIINYRTARSTASKKTWPRALGQALLQTLIWGPLAGLVLIARGAVQTALSPLCLIVKIPLRSLISCINGFHTFFENRGLVRLVRQGQELLSHPHSGRELKTQKKVIDKIHGKLTKVRTVDYEYHVPLSDPPNKQTLTKVLQQEPPPPYDKYPERYATPVVQFKEACRPPLTKQEDSDIMFLCNEDVLYTKCDCKSYSYNTAYEYLSFWHSRIAMESPKTLLEPIPPEQQSVEPPTQSHQ
jgi:hypothetical protein